MLSLYSIVQKSGGLSLPKSRRDHNIKEDFIQSGLMGCLQDRSQKGFIGKGRRSLDDLAGELITRGIIPIPGDNINEGDYLLQLLQEERLGNPVTIEQLENYERELEIQEMELEAEIYGEEDQEDLEGFTREIDEDQGETGFVAENYQGGEEQRKLIQDDKTVNTVCYAITSKICYTGYLSAFRRYFIKYPKIPPTSILDYLSNFCIPCKLSGRLIFYLSYLSNIPHTSLINPRTRIPGQ